MYVFLTWFILKFIHTHTHTQTHTNTQTPAPHSHRDTFDSITDKSRVLPNFISREYCIRTRVNELYQTKE